MILTDGKRTIVLQAQGTIDGFINSGWTEVTEKKETKAKEKPATAPKKQSKTK